jgi:signal transduction histidine kinase
MQRANKNDEKYSLKFQFTLFFIFFMAAIYSVVIITVKQQVDGITETISVRLGIPVAVETAALIDGDAFERLSKTLDPEDPYYEKIRLEMLEKKEKADCLYLYTMAPVSDRIFRYIIDGSAAPDDLEHFSPLGSEEDISSYRSYVQKTMETKTPQSSSIDYNSQWGWVITAYAPILNSAGESVGFVGCDFHAETVYAQMWIRIIQQLGLSTLFIVLGFGGYLYMIDKVNLMLKKLREGSVEIREYLDILENVNDGLFLLDSSLRVEPYYSSSLEKIFRRKELAGMDLTEVFSGFFDRKTQETVKEFFKVAFDPNIQWRGVERLNPLKEVTAYFDNLAGGFTERHLEFVFRRVGPEDRVNQLLVVVRDITERVELVEEIGKARDENRQEMEMLQKILHVEPGTIQAFMESARQDAEAINRFFRRAAPPEGPGADTADDYRARLDIIFRYSHSLKGDAELLALDFLSEQAEEMEQKIMALRKMETIGSEDFLPLVFSCSTILSTLEKLDALLAKWTRFSDAFRLDTGARISLMEDSLKQMAKRLASRYGKKVEITITGLEDRFFKPAGHKATKDILVQLVRNSIYHGIETPELRRKAGKNEIGVITIKAAAAGSFLHIVYRDDGAGIDSEKIKNHAIKTGIVSTEKANSMNEREQILLIFHPGFSTAENPDRVAGKGVGLSLVTVRTRELHGKISLKSRRGSYSEFTLVFPLESLSGDVKETLNTRAG